MSKQKFQIIEGDYDYEVATYSFSGRMTKLRWELLDRYTRKHSNSFHCGCQHDCCGCVSTTNMSFEYAKNLVTLTSKITFNY